MEQIIEVEIIINFGGEIGGIFYGLVLPLQFLFAQEKCLY